MTTNPDPRPVVTPHERKQLLEGWRCGACGHPSLWSSPRCPICGESMTKATFGPQGTVWSSTVVRVPVPGRTPPYAMAYVDLDDGPRILAHVAGPAERLPIGSTVRLVASNAEGDVMVEVSS